MEVETIEAVLVLAERAHSEGARSMRAGGDCLYGLYFQEGV
jgi:hypothetical protein